jgi:aminopeptidase
MHTTEDERIKEFAKILVEHSVDVKEGDNVYLLSASLESLDFFEEVRRQILKKGAHPHEHLLYDSQIGSDVLDYDLLKYSSEEQLGSTSEARLKEMKEMDCYIRIGGYRNIQELSNIDSKKISAANKGGERIKTIRFDLDWVATRYPTTGMAQSAGMSNQELEEEVFESVTQTDWQDLKRKNQEIIEKMDDSKVRIVGENTDVTLSLKGRKGVNCHGNSNMPDGEVFYAPVKDSIEGEIEFNYPGVESGTKVHGIRLKFENGRIVDFEAESNQDFLESMINTDEGSRYIGELGIGTNSQRDKFIGNTLLDEKIGGSIHVAIGRAYKISHPNEEERNQSAIHWDLIKDLRPESGGGKIIVDGEVIQEDGEWVF